MRRRPATLTEHGYSALTSRFACIPSGRYPISKLPRSALARNRARSGSRNPTRAPEPWSVNAATENKCHSHPTRCILSEPFSVCKAFWQKSWLRQLGGVADNRCKIAVIGNLRAPSYGAITGSSAGSHAPATIVYRTRARKQLATWRPCGAARSRASLASAASRRAGYFARNLRAPDSLGRPSLTRNSCKVQHCGQRNAHGFR